MTLEGAKILDEVRKNSAALDACPGPHDFSVDVTPNRPLFKRWKCARCGGVVDAIARYWYELGRAHERTRP